MKNKPLFFLKIDVGLQGLILIAMSIILIGWLVTQDNSILIYYLLGQFFLGIWQVFSALILVFIYKSQIRKNYLTLVALYFFLLMLLASFRLNEYFILIVVGLIIPMAYALWYFKQTISESKVGTESREYIVEGILDHNYDQL